MVSKVNSKKLKIFSSRKFLLTFRGYFENETLGDIKNSKQKQKEIVQKVTAILKELRDKKDQVAKLRQETAGNKDFFRFEGVRAQLTLT